MTRLATYNTRAKAKFLKADRLNHGFEPALNLTVSDDLWASSILPEGCLERWRVADGAIVHLGQAVAELKIEDALHEFLAPASGRLSQSARAHSVVEPGTLLGRLEPERVVGV